MNALDTPKQRTFLNAILTLVFGILLGTIAVIANNALDLWGLRLEVNILLLLIFSLAGSLSFLLLKSLLKISWYGISLSVYTILFSFSLVDFARLTIKTVDFPAYLALLPLLVFFYLVRKHKHQGIISTLRFENFLLVSFLAFVFVSEIAVSTTLKDFLPFVKLSIFIANYFLLSRLIDNHRLWRQLIWLYVLSTVVVLMRGIYFYHFNPLHWARLVIEGGRSSNVIGFASEMAFIILAGLVLTARSKRWMIHSVLLLIIAYALIITLSRGTWAALIIALSIFFILSLRQIKWKRVIIFLILTGSAFVFSGVPQNIIRSIDESSERFRFSNINRVKIFERYLDEINNTILVGRGLNRKLELDLALVGRDTRSAHNSFITTWMGGGFPAFLILLSFLAVHWLKLWKVRVRLNQRSLWGNILVGSYCAMLAHSMLGDFISGHIFWFLLALQGAAANITLRR